MDEQISDPLWNNADAGEYLCFIIFSVYVMMSMKYTLNAFMLAHKKYLENKSQKDYNLYNLIFADTEFENNFMKTDLNVRRFITLFITIISMILIGLLIVPPRDEMLQFINESGLINVYLIILSFLISPVEEEDLIRFEGQIEAMKL